MSNAKTNSTYVQTTNVTSIPLPTGTVASGYCNKFRADSSDLYNESTKQGFTFSANGYLRINFLNSVVNIASTDDNTTRVSKIVTWLTSNNTTIYYLLVTPIEEEITEPTLINQLNAIKYGAESYYDITNLNVITQNAQPTIEAKAYEKI